MAVKIGKIPPCEQKTKIDSGAAFDTWIDDNGQFGILLDGHDERRHKMEFIYEKMSPDWQDRQKGRNREFSELFNALGDYGLFSRDDGKKRKWLYCPAANRQLETIMFSYHCRNDDSIAVIGADIVGSKVHEGKKRLKQGNADFVVADAFHVPFEDGSLDTIVDIAGAAWCALDTPVKGKADKDVKSLLYEWHRALGPKGAVVLDDFPKNDGSRYLTTMHWLEKRCPDIFEDVQKGGFYFPVGDYRVAFKAKTVKVGREQAYVFEKA